MTDLADWLLQQIADDEAAARAATGNGGTWQWRDDEPRSLVHWWHPDVHPMNVLKCTKDWSPTAEDAAHIARHDPARVLAEVAAKEARVRLLSSITPASETNPIKSEDAVALAERLLLLEAQPYADRPGFDPAWKVEM